MEHSNHNLQEQVHSLLNGQLAEPEKARLLAEAAQNPETADEIAFGQAVVLALRHPEMAAANATISSVIETEGFPPPSSPSPLSLPRFFGKWLAIAALGALSVAGGYYLADSQGYFGSEAQKMGKMYLAPMENVLYPSSNSSVEESLAAAVAAYEVGNYKKAAAHFRSYADKYPSDQSVQLYLGVCLLLSGDQLAAVGPLVAASKSDVPPLRVSAQWYLALTYLANDEPDSARSLLESMQGTADLGEKPRQLLGELRKMSLQ